jgi:pimeloyl-ACP methyl ester carboxylesterase
MGAQVDQEETATEWSNDQREIIQTHLDTMAADELFSNAPKLTALLRYLVKAELAGDARSLGQTSIALEVLDRGADFDPSVDSVVRVEAGRLRARLREFNSAHPDEYPVVISLPKGRYKPHLEIGASNRCDPVQSETQQIRFLKTDDEVSIAYSTCGSGPPLVKVANWLSHLEYDFESPIWSHWWQELASRYTLIRYDERGCGLSDWEVEDFSVNAWLRDLECVTDKISHNKFALLGISQGASVAVRYAIKHPERVSHLILYGGFAQGALIRDHTDEQRREYEILLDLVASSWGREDSVYRNVFGSLFMPDGKPAEFASFEALQRYSCSPENARLFLGAFYNIDVSEYLSDVTVPTLILHARNDKEIPVMESELMAKAIPDAQLVYLDSERNILAAAEPAWQEFLREIDRFIGAKKGVGLT